MEPTIMARDLIQRFNNCRQSLKKVTTTIERGNTWERMSARFDAELLSNGYRFTGTNKLNYMPGIVGHDMPTKLPPGLSSAFYKVAKKSNYTVLPTDDLTFYINSRQYYQHQSSYLAYDYLNSILNEIGPPKKVLDLGAGSGIACALFKEHCNSQVFIIDLPEMILLSSAFLMHSFPEAKFILPNEIDGQTDL